MSGLRALMVCYNFPPWAGGGSVRADAFVRYLPQYGVAPEVLTIEQRYIDKAEPVDDSLLERIGPEISITRTRSMEPEGESKIRIRDAAAGGPDKKPSALGRILAGLRRYVEPVVLCPDYTVLWTPYALSAARRIDRAKGVDVVYAVAPPYGVLLTGYLISLFLRKPLVIDVKDIWIGSPLYRSASSIVRAMDRFWERKIVRRASRTIVATQRSLEDHRKRHHDVAPERFTLIPNGVDPVDFTGSSKPPAGRFVATIAGLLDERRNPRPFLKACLSLIEQGVADASAMQVNVPGLVHSDYIRFIENSPLKDIVHLPGAVTHREFAGMLESSHLLVLLPSVGIPTAIPGKLYEYLLARRPMLCMAEPGAAADLVNERGLGELVSPEDVRGAALVIERTYKKALDGAWRAFEPPPDLLQSIDRRILTGDLADVLKNAILLA